LRKRPGIFGICIIFVHRTRFLTFLCIALFVGSVREPGALDES
jgi:hypothetical protein